MITLKVWTFAKIIPVVTVNMVGVPISAALFSVEADGPLHGEAILMKRKPAFDRGERTPLVIANAGVNAVKPIRKSHRSVSFTFFQ